ncbi:hypothetical protein Pryu01_00917 [Paraliobacillus ryukyuensis]
MAIHRGNEATSLKEEPGTKLVFNYSTRMTDENLTIATGNTLTFCGQGLWHTGRGSVRCCHRT